MSDFPCPYQECDGSGWIPIPPNDARRCRCMDQRVAARRARGLSHKIPKRYRDVGFERFPVTRIDPEIVHEVREYCAAIEDRLDAGDGLWFAGPKGTGKTTLAMIVSQHALQARRTVAIYTAPVLLAHISDTYDEGSEQSYLGFLNRLASVDLLHIDDLAVARQNEWVLEQLYTVINRRYEDQRSVIFTADVSDLADHVGARAYSRLLQMCGDPLILEGEDARVTFPAPS
jgi:DNA replication protein DnaC